MPLRRKEKDIPKIQIESKSELTQTTKSCFVAFSSRECHINNVRHSIKRVLKDRYDYDIKTADGNLSSGEGQLRGIVNLIENCAFGIVILDGLRPNIPFEYGVLSGLRKPVVLLKEKDAQVDIAGYYGGPKEDVPNDLPRIKMDPNKHFSNIKDIKYLTYDQLNLEEFEKDLEKDFKKKLPEIKKEIKKMITPRGGSLERGEMEKSIGIIAEKIAKTGAKLIEKDQVETDQAAKVIDELTNELNIKMPANYYLSLGNVYLKSERYEESIKSFDKALEIKSNFSGALCNKGVALSRQGDHKEAMKIYGNLEKTCSKFTKCYVIWLNKGIALEKLGKFKEAIKCFDKALEIDPKNVGALNNKGIALAKSGKAKEAIKCFDKALEIDPKNANVWNNKGNALDMLDKAKEAIKCFDKALEIYPKNKGALYNKGIALAKSGKAKEAIKCFDKALEIDPKNADTWYAKGKAQIKSKEAIKCFDKALELDPNHCEALCSKGANLSNIGKPAEALEYMNKAEKLCTEKNECTIIWANKGTTLSKIGNYKEALKYANKAVAIDPKATVGYNSRGAIYVKLKKYKKALADYKKALELNPKDVAAYYNMACLYALKKEKDKLIENLKRLIQLDPKYKEDARKDDDFKAYWNKKWFKELTK